MKEKIKYLVFLVYAFMAFSAVAQPVKKVKVKDPDLKFSYMLPQDWRSDDHELYHYIISDTLHATVALTYYEGACPDLADCYLGELEALRHSLGEEAFQLLTNGTELITGSLAMWIKYTYAERTQALPEVTIYLYLFVWKGQYFKVEASGYSHNAATWSPIALGIIRSLKVK